jgi:hypothetical protein
MTKKKKLVKTALANPEVYAPAELKYFELWLAHKKNKKENKKKLIIS